MRHEGREEADSGKDTEQDVLAEGTVHTKVSK